MMDNNNDQRYLRVNLVSMGKYSKVLVIPRWWIKLNGEPESVEMTLALGFMRIEPTKKASTEEAKADLH
jgi:hypothetical protein